MQITDGATAARTFAELMVSDEPRPDYADVFRPFAPLIGSWDLDVAWYDETGTATRRTKGEWHFAWALDARVTADTITLESQTATTRWQFTGITESGFHWRNEDEDADGNIILRQTFVATRQP
jgi:hypothetical protein